MVLAVTLAVAFFIGIQVPPARFDRQPPMPIVVKEVSDPNEFCRRLSGYRGEGRILACALPFKAKCFIIWPAGQKRGGLLWRHERAHCSGWPAHHPR